jgi:hypothetical protein
MRALQTHNWAQPEKTSIVHLVGRKIGHGSWLLSCTLPGEADRQMLVFTLNIHNHILPLRSTQSLHGIPLVVGYDPIDPFDIVPDPNTRAIGLASACYPRDESPWANRGRR